MSNLPRMDGMRRRIHYPPRRVSLDWQPHDGYEKFIEHMMSRN